MTTLQTYIAEFDDDIQIIPKSNLKNLIIKKNL